MRKILYLIVFSFLGCSRYDLHVAHVKLSEKDLSSWHVSSPDPQLSNPSKGERLIIKWKLPAHLLRENPQLIVDILYKDYKKTKYSFTIEQAKGSYVLDLVNHEYITHKGFLSYDIRLANKEKTYADWTHQLWVELINIEEDDRSPE
ncbi:MAG: hypothetical protein ACOVOR_02505 [Rhabdochlamydiaceae bacterium]